MIKRTILPFLEKEMHSDKVIVLTGMRRVGKTTLIRFLYEQLQDGRKLFLDLENPLNQTYFSPADYEKVKLYLDQLAVGSGNKLTVFLDEIQNVQHIPSVVKYLSDHYAIKFILTGSASFYLKNLFSESLAGRKRLFELFPLDFEEFLSFKAPQIKKPTLSERIDKPLFLLLDTYFSEYLAYGGFPSVVQKATHEEKIKEMGEIFTSYYQHEVRLLSDFRKLEIMKAAIRLLLSRVGQKLDVTKIAAELGISRITIKEYLDFLEGTYFIQRIYPYSRSLDVSLRAQPKVYLCDNGFLVGMADIASGQRLENSIYGLLRNNYETYFYQSKGGAEIDFITKKDTELSAYEVKIQAHPSDVAKLKRISQKLKVKNFFVVSQKYLQAEHVIYPFQL